MMESLEKLLNATTLPALVLTGDGDILRANDVFYRWTGSRPGKPAKADGLTFFSVPDREAVKEAIRATLQEAAPASLDLALFCADGSTRPLHWTILTTRLETPPHQQVAFLCASSAAAGPAQGDAKLNQESLRLVFDNVGIGMMCADEHAHIVLVNKTFEDLLGYTRAEAEGKMKWTALVAFDEDLNRILDYHRLRNTDPDAAPSAYDARIKTKNGEILDVVVRVTTMPQTGYRLVSVVDLTAERKAQQIVREREARYRSLVDNMQDTLYRCDTQGNLTFINASGAKSLGYDKPEEMLGKNIAKDFYWRPELRDVFLKDLARTGKLTNYEVTLRHKDGSPISIVTNSRFFHDEKGNLLGVEGLFMDVTQQKAAQRAMIENQDRLEAITKTLPGVVYQFCASDQGDYRLNFASGRMLELFGLSPEDDDLFAAFLSHIYGDDQDSLMASIRQAVETRSPWNYEGRFVKPSGDLIWFHGLATPSWYDNQLVFNGILLDISERKRDEEKRKEAEILYETLVNALPDGVILTDLGGQVMYASRRALSLYGLSGPESLAGRSILDFVAEESYEKAVADYRRLVESGGVMTQQYVLLRDDGSSFPAEVFGSLITDGAGRMKGTLYVAHDITERRRDHEERKRLEQQIIHAQKMEAIGKLAGGVAHDFNNILMGIQGNASLMLMDVSPAHPYHQRLSRIEDHVARGTRLTRQLLGFARGGKYEVKILSINDLIRKSAQIFVETRKEIEAEFDLQPDAYPVEADAGQIEQVLLNLFINAAQAMPQGGFLHIKTENTELPEPDVRLFKMQPGRYVKISVTDTGSGMDRDVLDKIFEPFFTTKAAKGGTGLGLASAYGIIRNHGGHIEAESESGKGAKFSLYLPASAKAIEAESETPAGQLVRGSGCILMVDDESMILHSAAEVLTKLGYTVHRAASGQEAVAIYLQKKKEIDLVILDMILPGMNGSQVLKMLKDAKPDVKVILSSGYGIDAEVRKVMDMGCRGFIAKPYSFSELSRLVSKVLQSS